MERKVSGIMLTLLLISMLTMVYFTIKPVNASVVILYVRLEPPDKTVVGEGFSIYILVVIYNTGPFPDASSVDVFANQTLIGSWGEVWPVGEVHLFFTWNTSGFTKGRYTIIVETKDDGFIDGVVVVTIPGDIDGDFRVSYKDLFALAAAYGGEPGLNPNCDIDGDNKVGYKDLFILASNYGKHYP